MSSSEHSDKSGSIDTFFEHGFEQLKQDYPSIQEIHAASKDFLYRQGDHCTYVFWIKSGIVKLSHLTAQGTGITIALLRKGDVIGHLQGDSVHQEMEETAQALGEVSYYRLAYVDWHIYGDPTTE